MCKNFNRWRWACVLKPTYLICWAASLQLNHRTSSACASSIHTHPPAVENIQNEQEGCNWGKAPQMYCSTFVKNLGDPDVALPSSQLVFLRRSPSLLKTMTWRVRLCRFLECMFIATGQSVFVDKHLQQFQR
jgi:hypothetical protein